MNQQKLEELTVLERELEDEKRQHLRKLKALNLKIRIARDACDHVRPDGTSSLVPSFIMNYCDICFESDL